MSQKTQHIIATRNGVARKFSLTAWNMMPEGRYGWEEKMQVPTPPEYKKEVVESEAKQPEAKKEAVAPKKPTTRKTRAKKPASTAKKPSGKSNK